MPTWAQAVLDLVRKEWLGLISALVAVAAWVNAYRTANVNVTRFHQEQEARKKADVVVVKVRRPSKRGAEVVIENAGQGAAFGVRAPSDSSLRPLGVDHRSGFTLPPGVKRELLYDVQGVQLLRAVLIWTNPDGTEGGLEVPLFKDA